MTALDLDAIRAQHNDLTRALAACPQMPALTCITCGQLAREVANRVPALLAEIERLRTENTNLREQLDRVNAGRQRLAEEVSELRFCVRCGHACNHNPPHRLVDTSDGPVCEDEAWCTQLRHADEARRAGIGAERLEGTR